ncbi:MAG: GAF domain-containing protein [Chloroflexi bacterium]|nr:GAF domain-containing protein [Chloroflexota bacterium]
MTTEQAVAVGVEPRQQGARRGERPPWAQAKRLLRDPIFWLLAGAAIAHSAIHYAMYIESLRPMLRGLPYFNLHALHQVEFLVIIAAAAHRFRWKGGAVMLAATLVASVPYLLTPYVFGRAPSPNELRDRGIEVVVMLATGAFLVYLLERVAVQAERAQHAWRERQATLNRLIALSTVSQTVRGALGVSSTVSQVLRGIAAHVHGRAFVLYLYDASARTMNLAAGETPGGPQATRVHIVKVDDSLSRYLELPIALFHRPALPPSMRFFGDMLAPWGMVFHAVTPLRFADSLLGMLVVSSDQRPIPKEDVALLSSLGHIIGLAIHNAQTVEASSAAGPQPDGSELPAPLVVAGRA